MTPSTSGKSDAAPRVSANKSSAKRPCIRPDVQSETKKGDLDQTLSAIQGELTQVQPLKEQLRKNVEHAMAQSDAECLRDCRLEVVGSSSWSGDVPQSDLDLVLITGDGSATKCHALTVLKALRCSLENLSTCVPATSQQVELIETAHVPILKIGCSDGLHCDVSVDQHHSVAHRDFFRGVLANRPEICDFVRLVKFWLYRRRLPTSADGGVPNLAWAVIAVRFAQTRPEGTPVEELFLGFFEEMLKLRDHSLRLRQAPLRSGWTTHETHFEWLPLDRSATSWGDEWLQLISVEDPCRGPPLETNCSKASTARSTVTSPSIPAALGLLYIVDLRLARNAICEGRWHDLWQSPAQAAPRLDRLAEDCKLHVILKRGHVSVAKMSGVKFCKGLLQGDTVNHRDQSSELSLELCKLKKTGPSTVCAKEMGSSWKVVGQPCHWVCALPVGPEMTLLPEGLERLAEIMQVVGITRVGGDLCDAVLAWKHAGANVQSATQHDVKAIAVRQQQAQRWADLDDVISDDPLMGSESKALQGRSYPKKIMNKNLAVAVVATPLQHYAQQDKAVSADSYSTCWDFSFARDKYWRKELADDSTTASDCDSQSTSGRSSDPSEALALETLVSVAEPRARCTKPCHPLTPWKPTLRPPSKQWKVKMPDTSIDDEALENEKGVLVTKAQPEEYARLVAEAEGEGMRLRMTLSVRAREARATVQRTRVAAASAACSAAAAMASADNATLIAGGIQFQ